jgi:hypothetical protein
VSAREFKSGLPWYDSRLDVREALDAAWQEFEWVPDGWKVIFREALRRLLATRNTERELPLMTMSVDVVEGALEFDMLAQDRVQHGIARKYRKLSLATCCGCGRRGLPRHFSSNEVEVLCAGCAAPRLLNRAISDAISYRGLVSGARNGVQGSLVPEVLRPHFAEAAKDYSSADSAPTGPRMTPDEYDQWLGTLSTIQAALPKV